MNRFVDCINGMACQSCICLCAIGWMGVTRTLSWADNMYTNTIRPVHEREAIFTTKEQLLNERMKKNGKIEGNVNEPINTKLILGHGGTSWPQHEPLIKSVGVFSNKEATAVDTATVLRQDHFLKLTFVGTDGEDKYVVFQNETETQLAQNDRWWVGFTFSLLTLVYLTVNGCYMYNRTTGRRMVIPAAGATTITTSAPAYV